jgi:hypothetical protein
MLDELVRRIAARAQMSRADAETALGLVLNASDRQGGAFAEGLFTRVPGARALAARAGAEAGMASGVIARMIERTPGGRRVVREKLFSALHERGLGHGRIARLTEAIHLATRDLTGDEQGCHIGDLFGGAGAAGAAGSTTTLSGGGGGARIAG